MVIGLAGYAQSGKDTLLELLSQHGSRNYVRFAFADALKHEIKQRIQDEYGIDIFNCTPEQKNSVRHIMVDVGAGRRAEDPDYWIKQTFANIKRALAEDPTITPVITDVRYENEAEAFRSEFVGSRIVVINRFGKGPANDEEAQYTSPLYRNEGNLDNIVQFSWSDVSNYTERDILVFVQMIESLTQ